MALEPLHGPTVVALTCDAVLGDELRRLAAAAAVSLEVRSDVPRPAELVGCRLLVVGGDLATSLAADSARRLSGLPPDVRPPLVVVTTNQQDSGIWQHAVGLAAEQVAVLPQSRPWLVERLAATGDPEATAHVVGVVGGCGGAGASVFAAALAVTAADGGRRVLLADLDPLGGGADLTLGVDDVPGLRWPDLAGAEGRLPSGSVREALPQLGSLAVLAWGRGAPVDVPQRAVEAALSAARRAHELVVIDLPRSVDVASCAVDEILLVVPSRMRAVTAAAQLLAGWPSSRPPVRAVVRKSGSDLLSARTVADVLDLPLALQMRDEARLDAVLGRSQPPGLAPRSSLRRAAEQWLASYDVGRRAA